MYRAAAGWFALTGRSDGERVLLTSIVHPSIK
jgi:hypothetical protein